MHNIRGKSVPDDVHAVLHRRAARAGKSLQEYLLALLTEEARRPTLDEVLDEVNRERGGVMPFTDAVRTLRLERERR